MEKKVFSENFAQNMIEQSHTYEGSRLADVEHSAPIID